LSHLVKTLQCVHYVEYFISYIGIPSCHAKRALNTLECFFVRIITTLELEYAFLSVSTKISRTQSLAIVFNSDSILIATHINHIV